MITFIFHSASVLSTCVSVHALLVVFADLLMISTATASMTALQRRPDYLLYVRCRTPTLNEKKCSEKRIKLPIILGEPLLKLWD